MGVASWDATGLLESVYKVAGSRDRLAAETGIPAPNLSAINNGRRPLTLDYAERIMAAYPNVTLIDLGGDAATVVQRRHPFGWANDRPRLYARVRGRTTVRRERGIARRSARGSS